MVWVVVATLVAGLLALNAFTAGREERGRYISGVIFFLIVAGICAALCGHVIYLDNSGPSRLKVRIGDDKLVSVPPYRYTHVNVWGPRATLTVLGPDGRALYTHEAALAWGAALGGKYVFDLRGGNRYVLVKVLYADLRTVRVLSKAPEPKRLEEQRFFRIPRSAYFEKAPARVRSKGSGDARLVVRRVRRGSSAK